MHILCREHAFFNYPVGSKQKCILCFKELDADMQLACFLACWIQDFECRWRFSGISVFPESLEEGRCRKFEQSLHSRRILQTILRHMPCYTMSLHISACPQGRSEKFYRTQQYVTATLEGQINQQNYQNVILYEMEYKYPGVYPFIECPLI